MNLTITDITIVALSLAAVYFGWHYVQARINDRFNAVYNRINNLEQDYYTAHERMHERVFGLEKIVNPANKCCKKEGMSKQFVQD